MLDLLPKCRLTTYSWRTKAETAVARWKRVIGDGLRTRKDRHRMTEINVGVHVLNRMLTHGRPSYVRIS